MSSISQSFSQTPIRSKHQKTTSKNKTFLKNKQVQVWARRLHIYISMALLLSIKPVLLITLPNTPNFLVDLQL
ncbi:Putative membrane protein (fragment) [Moritella yayanosii]|uniref:Membrane protein n=1 Tax=Moritella yayanosii TaxID=69539 RepID=A0A330LPI8_9GAMM